MISIKRIARILLLLNRVEVSCCSVIIVISFGSPEKNFTTETQSARRRKKGGLKKIFSVNCHEILRVLCASVVNEFFFSEASFYL